jgi:hypothetical protein
MSKKPPDWISIQLDDESLDSKLPTPREEASYIPASKNIQLERV